MQLQLACACGHDDFASFGPYKGDAEEDLGLVWILTCCDCGEQLRIYQTSDAWRKRRDRIDGPLGGYWNRDSKEGL